MRYALVFASLLFLGTTGAFVADSNDGFQSAQCPKPVQAPEKAAFKRLGELPPADAFRAVLRSDDDCRGRLVQARDQLGRGSNVRR